ncbi:MAG: phosphoribosylglycinamide formyltransferase [Thalassobaculales bacterium]
MKRRVGVLVSGRGSNLGALIRAAADPAYPAAIALVLSNRPEAPALALAAAAGIATATIPHRDFASREEFDAAVEARLTAEAIELVCLAGFMRIFSAGFATRWQGRILNIHPSLLPAFKGLHPHRQALEAGVRISGCTVHFVTPELDAGPIVAQAAVPVLPQDDEAALAQRVLAAEHRCYPVALALVARGLARLEGGRTVFAAGLPETGLEPRFGCAI